MELGPNRSARPGERATAANNRVTQSQPKASAAPSPAYRESSSHNTSQDKSRFSKKLVPALIALLVIIAIVVGGWLVWSSRGGDGAIDGDKYQAVFFTNGQVYFGKLQPLDSQYVKLTDIYYLQSQTPGGAAGDETDSENPQEQSSADSSVQLIKLGDEVHGPEDEMIISRDQMMFYENLKPDSEVSELIKESKAS